MKCEHGVPLAQKFNFVLECWANALQTRATVLKMRKEPQGGSP